MKKIAFVFPGQGAQYVGMGKDFCQFESARTTFEEADDLLKEKLSQIIWEGPLDLLTETKNSQLAIFVVSCALLHTLKKELPELQPASTAGLSLGEYTALYAAGKISFEDALLLIQKRALFMDEACRKKKGGMAAVLGMETSHIRKILEKEKSEVWVANCNCPGQVVISGSPLAIEKVTEVLKQEGARKVIPLQVHGAFHSPYMAPAMERLEPFIRQTKWSDSGMPIAMNVPGDFVSFKDIPGFLIQQVVSSVRWDESVQKMYQANTELFLEIGPGKTLTGLNRKIAPNAECISIDKVSDLHTFLETVAGTLC
ncbi:MAG TPA: ACP S-malonyltransferase [Chlamydiales bacterium]|nr:ACP S-malonyltransferase [Chlamydiales bacterium]